MMMLRRALALQLHENWYRAGQATRPGPLTSQPRSQPSQVSFSILPVFPLFSQIFMSIKKIVHKYSWQSHKLLNLCKLNWYQKVRFIQPAQIPSFEFLHQYSSNSYNLPRACRKGHATSPDPPKLGFPRKYYQYSTKNSIHSAVMWICILRVYGFKGPSPWQRGNVCSEICNSDPFICGSWQILLSKIPIYVTQYPCRYSNRCLGHVENHATELYLVPV